MSSKYIVELADDTTIEIIRKHFPVYMLSQDIDPRMEDPNLVAPYYNLIDNLGDFFIAGGSMRSIHERKNPKDWDLYFQDTESRNKIKELVTSFPHTEVAYENKNAIGIRSTQGPSDIDLVSHYGDVESVLESFDYVIAKKAFFRKDGKYYTMRHVDYDKHMKKAVAAYDTNYTIESSDLAFERLTRYVGYGYYPTKDTLLKLFELLFEETQMTATAIYDTIFKYEQADYEKSKENGSLFEDISIIKNIFTKDIPNKRVSDFISKILSYGLHRGQYGHNMTNGSTTIIVRAIRNISIGEEALSKECIDILRKYLYTDDYDPNDLSKSFKNNCVKSPQLVAHMPKYTEIFANFLKNIEQKYSEDNIIDLLHFICVPTGYASFSNTGKVLEECCQNDYITLSYYHAYYAPNTHDMMRGDFVDPRFYSIGYLQNKDKIKIMDLMFHSLLAWDLSSDPVQGVERWAINRDNEITVVEKLLEKYGVSDTITILEGLFNQEYDITVSFSYDEWDKYIKNNTITPELPIGLILNIIKPPSEETNEDRIKRQAHLYKQTSFREIGMMHDMPF